MHYQYIIVVPFLDRCAYNVHNGERNVPEKDGVNKKKKLYENEPQQTHLHFCNSIAFIS